jgi:dihydroorotase
MDKSFIITNARIVNEGRIVEGSVVVKGDRIHAVLSKSEPIPGNLEILDADGKLLMPGVIDCHVHFREPGLTHKADIGSESQAAVAGGVTSFFEMPNTIPQTTSLRLLEEKNAIASGKSLANYSFFLGASNDNIEEIATANPSLVCGVKVFFGASTGNMLVDNIKVLEEIFRRSPIPVAAHCEDEATIRINSQKMRELYGEKVPVEMHPLIRSAEACYKSSELAVSLARKYNTRLHITHLSSARELDLLDSQHLLKEKRITAEACIHYLWFCDQDYARLGTRLKVNPSIKSAIDRSALFQGLMDGKLDIISTDHAPHLLSEKANNYFNAPSGTPLVQHSLPAMLEFWKQDKISLEMIVEKMCHAPADCYSISDRGFIRPGYYADLILVDPDKPWTVNPGNVLSKCGWSVFEGTTFHSSITHTFVNGNLVFENGHFNDSVKGKRITFNR